MARQETGESSNLGRSKAPSFEGRDRAHDPHSNADFSLVPSNIDSWIQGLVAGWLEKNSESCFTSDELDLFLLFQGRYLESFERCLASKLMVLESENKLPSRRPDEDYPIEFLPVVVQAYDEVSAEVGWDPLNQIPDTIRALN